MEESKIRSKYFEWLYDIVCKEKFSSGISHKKLLHFLHSVEFTYIIDKDRNRYSDGVDLRRRFALSISDRSRDIDMITDYLNGPCSVLEMMVALAITCEENIMDDPLRGDRTRQWFWQMIVSLGLGGMRDGLFDEKVASRVITRFLNREYRPDGKGGLFTIKNCRRDLREVEIWHQLCWYLNSIS